MCIAALGGGPGCSALARARTSVVRVPGHLEIKTLKRGEPAPFDGWLLPPSVMAEVGDCLSATLEKGRQQKTGDKPLGEDVL